MALQTEQHKVIFFRGN